MTCRAPTNRRRDSALCAALMTVLFGGCSGPIFRPQSPEARIDMPPMPDVRYVAAYTHPYGMNYVQIEAVALVTRLPGTGSDPPPSPQRAAMLSVMKRHEIPNPNEILASQNTSLVLARAILRPGLQEGDRFDVEVRVPSRSETKSLRNGWMLSTEMTELAVLGQEVRAGHTLGLAEGPVLVDPSADDKNLPLSTHGRILGGGVSLKSRSLGLVIGNQHKSFNTSLQIGASINRRFSTHINGRKQGVANPKTDDYIELVVHPRYKDNVARYMQVVRNVAIDESPSALLARLRFLEHQLGDPLTAANASIRLEAIGDEQAKEILRKGSASSDPEVRFYSAEALAYLDDTSAADVLARVAREEPAFRVNALAALSAMDDVMAYDALRSLLEVKSAETRYGAFRAMWAMNEQDPFVRGETLGGQFSYHELDVPGAPMIHATRSFRPEIVLFGKDQHFQLPLVLDAGRNLLVNGLSGGKITVSRFSTGAEPEQRVVSTEVSEVIRAIVELGGTYPDVVQALQQAQAIGALSCRFAVEALPEPGRAYDRNRTPSPTDLGRESSPAEREAAAEAGPQQISAEAPLEVATPLPGLFQQPH